MISVVVPFFNEEDNIDFVLDEIVSTLKSVGKPFEIIAIDDGSTDTTAAGLKRIAGHVPELRILTHERNLGQAPALWSGLEAVTGDIVITIDGDRQNDFRDVPRLLPLLEKYDAVFGQRMHRQDPVSKRIATRIAYGVRNFFLKDGVYDTACAFKLFKKSALKHIIPFAGFQRFIPFLLKEAGVSYIAVETNHRHRVAGKSKFSMLKLYFLSTIVDLACMTWYKSRNVYAIRRRALLNGTGKAVPKTAGTCNDAGQKRAGDPHAF